jgi:hypothetical protein
MAAYCIGSPFINHLLFVDGSFFFCKASIFEVSNLKHIPETYQAASGQEINYKKYASHTVKTLILIVVLILIISWELSNLLIMVNIWVSLSIILVVTRNLSIIYYLKIENFRIKC